MNRYIKTLPINLNTSISQPVYFFSNDIIDNNIYLCQQSNSIQNALFIIDVWNKHGYNIGIFDSYTENLQKANINIEELTETIKNDNMFGRDTFNLSKQEYNKSDYNYYIYISDDNIIDKYIGNGDDNYKIIIYKKDNILHYIALLNFEKPIEKPIEKKCQITGLKYKGNSCYQDSVLLSLFAIPNKFITKYILKKNVEELSKNPKREIKCSSNLEDDILFRSNIKNELINIAYSMRNIENKNVKNCSNLRELIKECPSTSGQRFYESGMQDAGEFVQYLFSLFEVTGIKLQRKMYITNELTGIYTSKNKPFLNLIKVADRSENTSPIVLITSETLQNSNKDININKYLIKKEDTKLDEKNLYKYKNEYYKRIINIESVTDAKYLIFYVQRKTIDENILHNKIIPNETIILANDKQLNLHSIVVYRNRHYTCYIKFNENWFYYNDLSLNIEFVGNYNEMIENVSNKPDPCKEGTLYFYSI